jgi:hypothetical protein
MSNFGTLVIFLTVFPSAGSEGNRQRHRNVILHKVHSCRQDEWKQLFADFVAANELLLNTQYVVAEWRCDPESCTSYDLHSAASYRGYGSVAVPYAAEE